MAKRTMSTIFRENTGKESAKKIRRKGYIPAVLYGYKGSKNIAVRAADFESIFEEIGEHSLISLDIDGKDQTEVIIKDFQLEPVKRNIIHVDFLEIEKGKLLRTEIPIKIEGTSKGVKKGGILEVFIRDLEIECLPKDIPECIPVQIQDLDIGDSLHVRDIEVDEKIKLLSNEDQVVLAIGTPTRVAGPAEAEAEEKEEVPPVAPAPEEE